MGDVLFTQQSAYILVQTTLIFSPTCSFIVMRQTPNWGFSRRTKRSLGDPLGACSAIYLMSFNQIIICLVDRSYPIELDINDTTNTAGSHSYIDLHLSIDNEDRSRTKLHNNFSILDFQFKCSDIPAVPAYGVYISQFIRYSRTCGHYQDFMLRSNIILHFESLLVTTMTWLAITEYICQNDHVNVPLVV